MGFLQDTVRRLQEAKGDPQSLAMVTLDLVLASKPEGLRRAVEAAAVPHWFDPAILAQLLDDDLAAAAGDWYRQVVATPFCEPFPRRSGHNLHEATRRGLRRRLSVQDPQRFSDLTRRAAGAFAGSTVSERIERVFHRLWADPEPTGSEIRQLEFDLRHRAEDGLALAAALHECISDESAPPLVRGWAYWTTGTVREPYLKIDERLRLAIHALEQAQAAPSDYATATAAVLAGDVLFERSQPGDAEKALGHYQCSLEIRERLLEANPESAEAARDVSVSLERLGDFLARRGQPGDAETALGHYQRSLEIRERLRQADPESARAAIAVAISHERLGDYQRNFGPPDTAAEHYQRSLEVWTRQHEANPASAAYARGMCIPLDRLGDFLAGRGQPGDAERALGHYQHSLAVRERLLGANPESAQAARDVSVSLERLGDFLARRGQPGDAEEALGHYRRSLEVGERLLAANPESAEAARDVAVSLDRLGDFLARRGQPGDAEQALSQYQRSLEVSERLRAASPESAQAERDVMVSHFKLHTFCQQHGAPDKSREHLRKCFAMLDDFAGAGRPMDAQMRALYERLKSELAPDSK